ncbi:MAG: hypothetical protein LBI84_00005 [Propionibacteriaceae bacterium]|nr:hypothetical protein [Propionibacteriaceae bacterium]
MSTLSETLQVAEALEGLIGDVLAESERHANTEKRALESQKTKLEDAELKLIQMFYDDMITPAALKKEQGRVAAQLAYITERLEAFKAGRVDARLRVRAYLNLAANCHKLYSTCDDTQKRQVNQAFFTRFTLIEDHQIATQYTGTYVTILDPACRLQAGYWQRNKQIHPAALADNPSTTDDLDGSMFRVSDLWWS